MRNPFQYGGIVGSEAFCNRKKEIKELNRIIENKEKALVYSERRFGKTSLIKLVFSKLPKNKFSTVYVDLWPTDDEISFAKTVAKGITEAFSTKTERALAIAKELFNRLRPVIYVDSEGKPNISFRLADRQNVDLIIDEALRVPAKLAKRVRKNIVIAFDEIQQINEYGNDKVEKKLRSIIQAQRDISYIFLGSRKSIIKQMFLDKKRPLYLSGPHLPLSPIAVDDWLPFIEGRFVSFGIKINKKRIIEICKLTQGHPFYTQHLCHAIWEFCEKGKSVTQKTIQKAVDTLLDRENYAYTILWETFTKNQQRLLKGLASEAEAVKPFSSEFIQRHKIGSASNSQRASKTLLKRDVLDHSNGSFIIVDRFFRLWIQKVQL